MGDKCGGAGKGGRNCYLLEPSSEFPPTVNQSDLLPGKKNLLSGEIKESLP